MRRRDGDEDDLVPRQQLPDAVHDPRGADVEALRGGVDHVLDGALGHARIVLEFHRRDRGARTQLAHGADEGDDRADAAVAGAARSDLGAEVEVGLADADAARPDAVIGSAPGYRRKEGDLGAVAQRLGRRTAAGRARRAPPARDSASACAPPRPIASAPARRRALLAVERDRLARPEASRSEAK